MSETNSTTAPTPQAPAEGAPAPVATPATVAAQITPQAPARPASADAAQDVASLPDWAQTLVKDLRAEAGAARTTAKANAATEARNTLVQDLGKALGLVKDGDTPPDPAALTAQLTEQQTAARTAQVELAVYRAATLAGADPAALLDSRAFLDSVKDVDPADATAITAAITKAITDNPRLKTVQAASKSGADLTGRTGETTSKTPLSLDAAVAASLAQ
ncbi:hypothetical protein [Sanguibacter sp. HDW7]|uniref:hypothetical protein n=1 Tax=Sanguibacter sp. HDW7 TaxID=2714931 RepID=UPI00140A2EDE|nr:hypothetical protein [Sanguibacter sp. HDW7]QIK82993.1 hypothetical protein G7063_04640 [Sanguibacter sp. HDW7]